jgi:DNA-binding beta-propeller fold protein YncE
VKLKGDMMSTQTVSKKRVFQYSYTLGQNVGTGAGFNIPSDFALGSEGRLYVVCRGVMDNPRTVICNLDEEYISDFGFAGTGDGQFIWPTGIAIDRDEQVYIADEALNRISIFDRDGQFIAKWGVEGDGDGQLNRPAGIAFDADDNLLIVDALNHRVQRFTRDGTFLDSWGTQGTGDGEFNMPWGVAVDDENNVYITDWRNDRIQKFGPDGQFLMNFGRSGSGQGELSRPTGLDVDPDGDIYVADWKNDRIQAFDSDGNFVHAFVGDATLSKWGRQRLEANPDMVQERTLVKDFTPEKRFWGPRAVKVDNTGRIICLDTNRSRFQIYQKGG